LKTINDDLFRLIKTLTKSEKGYFKKFASRNTPGEKNNYIILFDAVDGMKTFDEDALLNKLKKTAFVSKLSVYKNYLFNLILKSLQSYSTYDTVNLKISELIKNAQTLEKKTLYKEALKTLEKAKCIAIKYENIKALLEILGFERSVLMVMPDKNVYEKRLDLYNQQQNLLIRLEKYFQFEWLSDRMVIFVEHKGDFRSEEREKEIKKIMSDPHVKDKLFIDYTSKRFFLHINLFSQLAKNNHKMIYYYLKKEVELINENKHMMDVNVRSYIHILVNYLLFSNLLKDKKGVKDAIVKINEMKRRIKGKIPLNLEISIQADTCYAEIITHKNNGDLKRGKITALKIENLLRNYKNEISMELKAVLLSHTACFYFIAGMYDQAIKVTNWIINEISPSFKKDQYDFVKLFHLVIHFELGNYDVIENSIDSVYRFMKQRKSIFGIESGVFAFLKAAIKTDMENLVPLYEDLLYNLEHSLDQSQSQITIGMFDFILWARSKVEHKSMLEMIKSLN